MSGPTGGPVFAFTAKHRVAAGLSADVVGLVTGTAGGSSASWLKTENADVVFQRPEDGQTPEIRDYSGCVVWFGVDDVRGASGPAQAALAVVGDLPDDYCFARDPDGRFIAVHANERAWP